MFSIFLNAYLNNYIDFSSTSNNYRDHKTITFFFTYCNENIIPNKNIKMNKARHVISYIFSQNEKMQLNCTIAL